MEEKNINLEEKQQCFNAFIEEYKEKSLIDKQQILVSEYKELIALFQELCIIYHIDYQMLLNREIIDINNLNYNQEDFVEAIYVYTQMFKDILSTFLLKIISVEEDNN